MERDRYGKFVRRPVRTMEDLTGKRFGRLHVERSAGFMRRGTLQNSLRIWKCICLPRFGGCGGVTFQPTNALNSGNVNSDGCLNREHRVAIGHANRRHGHTVQVNGRQMLTPTWISWRSMMERCGNPNPAAKTYRFYFGKGIRVCRRWSGKNGFSHFLKDLGLRPKGSTLDRKNSNKHYTPSNTGWSTVYVQNHNRSLSTSEIIKKGWVTRRANAKHLELLGIN
jgi:hypothetical protein